MVRLARARQTDPAILADHTGRFQGRETPELDVDYMRLSPEALAEDRVPRQRKDQTDRLKGFYVWLNCQLYYLCVFAGPVVFVQERLLICVASVLKP